MTKKFVIKQICLFLTILMVLIPISLWLGFLYDENHPTYESVPYTVEEPKVYVTQYGDCYHSSDCSYLHSSRIAKGKDKAIEQGYRTCSRCYGIANGTIEVVYYEQVKKDMTRTIIIQSIIGGLLVGVFVYAFIPKKRIKMSST